MKQIHKFLLLGIMSTLVDYGVYSFLIWLGIGYVVAIVAGYAMGLWYNYEIGRRFIFTKGIKVSSERNEFVAVVLIAFGGMLINIGIVKLMSYSVWHLDPMISRGGAIGIAFFWNYFARKRFVYH